MPASLKLQQQYGSDLAVLFVECQGANEEQAEAFAWRQKWMGTEAMWSLERPVQVEGNGLPKFALLDTEGKLILSGNPLAMKKQIEEAITAEVKRAKSAPAGTPDKLAKVWTTFVKGDVKGAFDACDAFASDAALAEAAKTLRAEMVARLETRLARVRWLIDNGRAGDATSQLAGLAKSVKGCAELEPKVGTEESRLATSDKAMLAEIEADKALAALQQKMFKDKPFEDANVKALAKLAEKHSGTKAGARAARLVKLAQLEPER